MCTPHIKCNYNRLPTLGSEGGAGGDGEGEAWPTDLCVFVGLDPLWLLLFWSSGLSGVGDGLGWADGETLLVVSAFAVVSLEVSMATEGGDKRREPEFKFWTSPSTVAILMCLSPGSTFPFDEWMLSMSPKMHSGW